MLLPFYSIIANKSHNNTERERERGDPKCRKLLDKGLHRVQIYTSGPDHLFLYSINLMTRIIFQGHICNPNTYAETLIIISKMHKMLIIRLKMIADDQAQQCTAHWDERCWTSLLKHSLPSSNHFLFIPIYHSIIKSRWSGSKVENFFSSFFVI